MKRLWPVLAVTVALALFWAAREAASWRPHRVGQTRAQTPKIGFSPDGRFLVAQSISSNIPAVMWELKSGQKRALPPGKAFLSPEDSSVSRLLVSPDGQTLAIITDWHKTTRSLDSLYRPQARFYSLPTGKSSVARVPDAMTYNWTSDGFFSPDSQRFTLATRRYFYEFNAANGQLLQRVKPRFQSRYSVFSPDGSHVLQELGGHSLIREVGGDREIPLPGSAQNPRMGWSPNGQICWQAQPYNTGFRFWNAQNGALLRTWKTAPGARVHFMPDSKRLAVATPHGLELRDAATGQLAQTLPGPVSQPFAIASNGRFAISVDAQGTLWKWRLK